MNDQPSGSRDATMPAYLPSVILLGTFALLLLVLLPRPPASVIPVEVTAEVTAEATAVVIADTTADNASIVPADAAADEGARIVYAWSCSGCHGADGNGNPPFAGGFLDSDLLDDPAALIAFLSAANPVVDPALAYPHPVRGGYPVLTDDQIAALVGYVGTLGERAG